jgi:acetyl esterase/lipase
MVDPELLAQLELMPSFDLTYETLIIGREAMDGVLLPLADYARPEIAVEERKVPGPEGAPEVPVIIYRPTHVQGPLPCYLNIHGGGYVMGVAAVNGPANVRTAAEIGCLIVSVDYRLAPEHPAPAGVEDCYAALAWIHKNADELGIDRNRVAIGGESAGGGLAAALGLLARDRGEYPICFQLLIYPMLDDRTAARDSENPHVGEFVWNKLSNLFAWRAHLGKEPGAEDVSHYAAPARAKDLAGLPPTYINVGALDLFLEEDIDYARRLLRSGVPTELHIYPGAYHGFNVAPDAKVSQAAERESREALARGLAKK